MQGGSPYASPILSRFLTSGQKMQQTWLARAAPGLGVNLKLLSRILERTWRLGVGVTSAWVHVGNDGQNRSQKCNQEHTIRVKTPWLVFVEAGRSPQQEGRMRVTDGN